MNNMNKLTQFQEEQYQKFLENQPRKIPGDWNDPRYKNRIW